MISFHLLWCSSPRSVVFKMFAFTTWLMVKCVKLSSRVEVGEGGGWRLLVLLSMKSRISVSAVWSLILAL